MFDWQVHADIRNIRNFRNFLGIVQNISPKQIQGSTYEVD